jgi:hypothetical protein
MGWSTQKKEFCCETEGKGCPLTTTLPPAEPYDCDDGYANWLTEWSGQKKAWCCANAGRGCATDATSASLTASDASPRPSILDSATTPSAAKESWDCQKDLKNFRAAWAESKKRYCCKMEGIGCEAAVEQVQFGKKFTGSSSAWAMPTLASSSLAAFASVAFAAGGGLVTGLAARRLGFGGGLSTAYYAQRARAGEMCLVSREEEPLRAAAD